MLQSFFKEHASYPDNVDATSTDIVFDIKGFFDKPVLGWGVFHSRMQNADRHFEVTMTGEWNENDGIINEEFVWSDGETQKRTWQFSFDKQNPLLFTIKAHDIVGTGYGRIKDNAMRMLYSMDVVRQNGQKIILDIDDRLYRVRDNVVINKTLIKKFGFIVGDFTSSFVK